MPSHRHTWFQTTSFIFKSAFILCSTFSVVESGTGNGAGVSRWHSRRLFQMSRRYCSGRRAQLVGQTNFIPIRCELFALDFVFFRWRNADSAMRAVLLHNLADISSVTASSFSSTFSQKNISNPCRLTAEDRYCESSKSFLPCSYSMDNQQTCRVFVIASSSVPWTAAVR